MTLAIVYSRAATGVKAPLVTVEVHLSKGLSGLYIVGLPETAVKESRERVRSALLQCQFEFPYHRLTINLAPADLPKEGGRFDLPIAIGILAASHQLPSSLLGDYEFVGELGLSGELRKIRSVLPHAMHAKHAKRHLIVPASNAAEAGLISGMAIFSANNLLEVCAHLRGEKQLPLCEHKLSPAPTSDNDLKDVIGQMHGKRALQIAAAGQHSLLMVGPPGTGKTMLATRLLSLMPLLEEDQALEVAAIRSCSLSGFNPKEWRTIPFRSPHHTSSAMALVGGGRPPRPGEISLAHHGILFLDELPEFNRQVLESLREPLESGQITISRAAYQTVFPAGFQLIATMNPCPCGFRTSVQDYCRCTDEQIRRYENKISGPLLDRIDLQVEIPRQSFAFSEASNISSAHLKENVFIARQKQHDRQKKLNARLSLAEIKTLKICQEAQKILEQATEKFNFSARVSHRILKIARTIADLEQSNIIKAQHVSEAVNFRTLDRKKNNL